MKPQRANVRNTRKVTTRHPSKETEPVEVCARIRNLGQKDDGGCIEITSDSMIRLTGPEPEYRTTDCKFYRVFSEKVGQKILFDQVANPMVDDLIRGKNGLLFTYGVTNSGKTYTMAGTVEEPGFLPRCLDMLFNSISGLQAPKYVFMPDGMNGFNIQTEADAMLDRQDRDVMPNKTHTKYRSHAPDLRYDLEHCQSENVNPDYRYAVFVSYVEIYNDHVYDLLGEVQMDPFNRAKPPQSKRLREDKHKNMFVYGVTQVEVKTTEEAFAALHQGQERRKIAHTHLNAESSRSHSILNVRLVQAPLDPLGEDLLQERSLICSSQLALVDLAGSERMTRTGADGARVREAGNINSSLMTLRRCLEQLRANQKLAAGEMVKYRNSKLTHLFKSYFEGRGKVKMVVCINPNRQEYDENFHVVQFAEVAQQVEVQRNDEVRMDKESIKRKAMELKAAKVQAELERKRQHTAVRHLNTEASQHRLYQRNRARNRTPSQSSDTTATSDTATGATSDEASAPSDWENLAMFESADFPSMETVDSNDAGTLANLANFLESRVREFETGKRSGADLGRSFRHNLSTSSVCDRDMQARLQQAESDLVGKAKDVEKLERQVRKLESKNQVLTRTTQVFEKDKRQLQEQLNTAEVQVKASQQETRRLEQQMRGAVANTKAQVEKQCEKRVRNVQSEMQEKMWVKDERLRQLKNIISDGRGEGRGNNTARSSTTPTSRRTNQRPPTTPIATPRTVTTTTAQLSSGRSAPSAAHRRRSRSLENLLAEDSKTPTRTPTTAGGSDKTTRSAHSHSDLHKVKKKASATSTAASATNATTSTADHTPIANKHRRSASTGNWLAHLPHTTVQTETILQPRIKPARVVNVPSPRDVAAANKYLLTHQSEATDGEIETQLVKGEVFHTRTGGQQVQFVDIETLKQSDPKRGAESVRKSPMSGRKRKSDGAGGDDESEQSSWTDVETRCAFGIGNNINQVASPKRTKK